MSGGQDPSPNSPPLRHRSVAPSAATHSTAKDAVSAAGELSDIGGEQSPPPRRRRRRRAVLQRPAYRSLATPSAAKEDFLGVLAPGTVVAARGDGDGGLCCARVVGRAEAVTVAARAREVGAFFGGEVKTN